VAETEDFNGDVSLEDLMKVFRAHGVEKNIKKFIKWNYNQNNNNFSMQVINNIAYNDCNHNKSLYISHHEILK